MLVFMLCYSIPAHQWPKQTQTLLLQVSELNENDQSYLPEQCPVWFGGGGGDLQLLAIN